MHVIVTERGICVNPAYRDLEARLKKAGLDIRDIHDLHDKVDKLTGVPDPIEYTDRVVAVIAYRDGPTIDLVRQIKG